MKTKASKLSDILLTLQKKDCANVKSIEDINKQFEYEDTDPWGKRDRSLLSCGQSESYNELERFYTKHLEAHVESSEISMENALKAICECCHEIAHEDRTHFEFKECLSKKLGVRVD